MAAAGIDGIFTSDNQLQCFSVETSVNCASCILMKEQLHSALLELQSAKTIISLLREDIKKATATETTNSLKPSLLHGSSGYEHAGRKLIPVVHSSTKRKETPTVTSMTSEHYYRSSDRFAPLNVNSEWPLVTTKNHVGKSSKRDKSATVKTDQSIKTVNRFTPLTKVLADNVDTIPVIVNGNITTKGNEKVINRNTSHKVSGNGKIKSKKIIIIGDSHARGCARDISNCLGKEFEVSGTVMPGAGLAHITILAHGEIPNLTSDDAVVIWGGSNDINKNKTSLGLRYLKNFINNKSNTNIQALTAPQKLTCRSRHASIMKFKYSTGNYIRSSRQGTM